MILFMLKKDISAAAQVKDCERQGEKQGDHSWEEAQ